MVARSLPSTLLDTVVFLFSGDESLEPLGTGFVVGYPVPGREGEYVPLIVTARHVIEGETTVSARFSGSNGGPIFVVYELPHLQREGDFFLHPDEGVDIVAFRSPHFAETRYQPIPFDLVATKETFESEEIQPTDRIVFPSMLTKFMGSSRNYPVIRDGSIALIPEEEVPLRFPYGSRWIETSQRVILVDATSIPGASGSPVFLWPGIRLRQGKFNSGGGKLHLLGVMHGFYPAPREVLEVEASGKKTVFEENTRIAIVFPSWRIHEILQTSAFRDRVNALAGPR